MNSLGIIGFGQMAQAMTRGWLHTAEVKPEQIYVCASDYDRLSQRANQFGVHPCRTIGEVLANSDWLLLALKPYQIEKVLAPYREELIKHLIISVAAGWRREDFKQFLGVDSRTVCLLPNTPVAVNQGVILEAISPQTEPIEPETRQRLDQLLGALGDHLLVPAEQLGAAGVLAGCGPAFGAMMIEALGDAGVKYGLPRELAYRLVSQMMLGTGQLQLETGEHPGKMKDQVCSPGGTTIVGVAKLEEKGFRSALIEAVGAIISKE